MLFFTVSCVTLVFFFSVGAVPDPVVVNQEFGLQLVQSQHNDDRNVLVNPLAITRSLLVLLNNNVNSKESVEELRQVLGLKKDDDLVALQTAEEELIQKIVDKNGEDQELSLLVRLLVQKKGIQSLKESFKRAVKEEVKKVLVEEVDFESNARQVTRSVNEWLQNGTRGRMSRFFRDDLDSKSSMVLLSASDFRGEPLVNLSQSAERKEFANFVSPTLPFMRQMVPYLESSVQELRLLKSNELESELLEVPYNKNISLIIVQPINEESLNALNENLTSAQLTSGVEELLKQSPNRLKVNIPKFKVEFDLELKEFLEDFDYKTLFNTSVTSGQRLTTSVHKAAFEVKENSPKKSIGDETTPSSGVKEFSVEKPFLFLLRDNSLKTILFYGKVNHLVDEEALGLGFI